MAQWLFWGALSAMLWLGNALGVGLLLGPLSRAAAMVGAATFFVAISLEQELHLFLFCFLLQVVVRRRVRRW